MNIHKMKTGVLADPFYRLPFRFRDHRETESRTYFGNARTKVCKFTERVDFFFPFMYLSIIKVIKAMETHRYVCLYKHPLSILLLFKAWELNLYPELSFPHFLCYSDQVLTRLSIAF